jgi:Ca2+-binding RTX toxin-like protein
MARYRGTTGNDQIAGAAENNYFYDFGTGRDILTGAGKSDVFYLTVDAITDFVDGRDGNDTIDYSGADRAVRIDLISGSVTATFHDQQHLLPYTLTVTQVQNIENATGSIYNDTIYGTDGNNTLDGNAGDDYLYGRDGKDTLLGGAGADHLYGGDQDDTLIGGTGDDYIHGGTGYDTVSYVDRSGEFVIVNLSDHAWSGAAPNTAVVHSTIPSTTTETDTLVSIENATGTGSYDDFYGSSAANVFDGGAGRDSLYGHGGSDTLIGGDDVDFLIGGSGADHLIGGQGSDWALYNMNNVDDGQDPYSHPGWVIISLVEPETNNWWAAGDTYDSIENIQGSPFSDLITGDDNDNMIVDTAGNNTFYGNGGRDTFIGNPDGFDTFHGGDDEDTVVYADANEPLANLGLSYGEGGDLLWLGGSGAFSNLSVTIDLEHQSLNAGAAGCDRFYFVEDIIGTSDGSDVIYGDYANNTFRGLGGNDRMMGRGGDDTLIGGDDSDTAVFSGNFADYTFRTLHFNDGERFLEVHDTHADRDGTDYVIQVEHLEFHNITVNTSDLMLLI